MAMTLAELMDHANNLDALLTTKRHQLAHMKIDSIARARHQEAINALEHRVRELCKAIEKLRGERADRPAPLRGDVPTLQLVCVRPGVPPLPHVVGQPQTLSDFDPASRNLCA